MAETPKLDAHHQATVKRIFTHPSGHNIEWHDHLPLGPGRHFARPGDRSGPVGPGRRGRPTGPAYSCEHCGLVQPSIGSATVLA
jgi:hypothetical protein